MPLPERDASLLWDMLDACRAVERFLAGRSVTAYLGDEILQAAIERKVQIVGEACSKLSKETWSLHPHVPWKKISGLRHILVHEYGNVEHDRMWQVATVHVPELAAQLAEILPVEA